MYLISTGGVFPPSPQHFGDLFAEVLPDAAQVLPRALELARDMAANVSPLASTMSRALMWEGPDSPEAAHLLESRVFHHMTGQPYVFLCSEGFRGFYSNLLQGLQGGGCFVFGKTSAAVQY